MPGSFTTSSCGIATVGGGKEAEKKEGGRKHAAPHPQSTFGKKEKKKGKGGKKDGEGPAAILERPAGGKTRRKKK